MRVLLSHENFDALGGTETYILTVAAVLLALGHEPMIYTSRPEWRRRSRANRGCRC